MAAVVFRRITIVGLGLMGGSLARALRRLDAPPALDGSSRNADDLERAVKEGLVGRASTDPAGILADADLVVYATPVRATLELLPEHAGLWRPDAVITDMGSVKRPVVAAALRLGLAGRFVGGHPMAGDHRSGLEAARADLYDGARIWLSPVADASQATGAGAGSALRDVAELWRALGAEPRVIDAARHDELVAWTSHLPQLAATAVGAALAAGGIDPADLGSGGRDVTRLAASPAALWADILVHNADAVALPLTELRTALATLEDALRRGDERQIAALFERAAAWREGSRS